MQLYSVQDFDKEELLTLLDNIFIENSKFRMKKQIENMEQAKILWLISIIDKKMQTCFDIGHNIFSQTISAQSELWNITVQQILNGNITNPEQYIRSIKDVVYHDEMQI